MAQQYTIQDFLDKKIHVQAPHNTPERARFLQECYAAGCKWRGGGGDTPSGSDIIVLEYLFAERGEKILSQWGDALPIVHVKDLAGFGLSEIRITYEDPVTVAALVQDGTVLKRAVATRCPSDKHSLKIGAELALSRLFQPDAVEVQRKAKRGEYIKIVKAYGTADLYKNGDILSVYTTTHAGVFASDLSGRKIPIFIGDSEYVVLEGYAPAKHTPKVGDWVRIVAPTALWSNLNVKRGEVYQITKVFPDGRAQLIVNGERQTAMPHNYELLNVKEVRRPAKKGEYVLVKIGDCKSNTPVLVDRTCWNDGIHYSHAGGGSSLHIRREEYTVLRGYTPPVEDKK